MLDLLKVPLVNAKNVELRLGREKNFDILFENHLALRSSPQSLEKKARTFSQSVAALIVTHPGA